MAGRLTTHVLDIVHGRPAAGIHIELFRVNPEGDVRERLKARIGRRFIETSPENPGD